MDRSSSHHSAFANSVFKVTFKNVSAKKKKKRQNEKEKKRMKNVSV